MPAWGKRRFGTVRPSRRRPETFLLARLSDSAEIEINWVDNDGSCRDYHMRSYPKRWHIKTDGVKQLRLRCPRSLLAWELENAWKDDPPGSYRGVLARARLSGIVGWDRRDGGESPVRKGMLGRFRSFGHA